MLRLVSWSVIVGRGFLVSHCRQDIPLLGWVFAAGGAAAFACAFFLALVLCVVTSAFTGVANHAAALRFNWNCCLDLSLADRCGVVVVAPPPLEVIVTCCSHASSLASWNV